MAFFPSTVALPAPPAPPVPPRRGGSAAADWEPRRPGGPHPFFYLPRPQPPLRPSSVAMPRRQDWPRGRLVITRPHPPVEPFLIRRRDDLELLLLEDPAEAARRRWRELRLQQLAAAGQDAGGGDNDAGAGEEDEDGGAGEEDEDAGAGEEIEDAGAGGNDNPGDGEEEPRPEQGPGWIVRAVVGAVGHVVRFLGRAVLPRSEDQPGDEQAGPAAPPAPPPVPGHRGQPPEGERTE